MSQKTAIRQVVLDTETTGLDPSKGHRLTEIGCIEMINRRLTGKRFQTYINPEREIEPGAAAISGLTNEFLLEKPKFSEIVEEFLTFIQVPGTELIIHNAPFDLGFLNYELNLVSHPWQPIENYVGVIDTLLMARRLHPGQRNNLDALCVRYNIDNSAREYHGAILDSELLAKVYLAMTAGQTIMSLGTEQKRDEVIKADIPFQPVTRTKPLRIIRASDEECRLHLEKMAELERK